MPNKDEVQQTAASGTSSKAKKKRNKKKRANAVAGTKRNEDETKTLASKSAMKCDDECDQIVDDEGRSKLNSSLNSSSSNHEIEDTKNSASSARSDKASSKSKSSSATSSPGSTPSPNAFETINPPLSTGILSAVQNHYKFTSMTPVQASVIPLFLQNKDVCVQAVTGSGKTLAFLIPMIEMILRRTSLLTKKQVGGLIISPTRELARQTYDVACILCEYSSLPEPLLLVGGGSGYRPVKSDLEAFSKLGSDLVIGTPGRLDDILSTYSALQMNELECLVLDEADVLLAMGFEVTLTNILSRLPKMRRTGLFSATKAGTSGESNKSVKKLMARAGLRNPVIVNVAIAASTIAKTKEDGSSTQDDNCNKDNKGSESAISLQEQATPSSLTNYYVISPLDEQLSRLVAFLKQHKDEKIIVFFMTCAIVEYFGLALSTLLPENKFYVELLHGKLAPKRREKAMLRFRNGGDEIEDDNANTSSSNRKGGILLCTDVAARGLDVPDIQWTIQFDAPVDPSQYIHRVGRSARAGRFGSSLIFLSKKEESFIDFLRMRKVPIEEISGEERCSPATSIIAKEEVGKSDKKHNTEENNQEEDNEKIVIPNILVKMKKMVLNDRDLLEKGTKAFTSYIRAYKEHKMQFIFRFASLDLGVLATSYSLLRLPKMPELRDKVGKLNFKPAGREIDIHGIQYKDKTREKARQKRLAAELAAGGKNAKQIKAEQRMAAKLQREKEIRQSNIAKGRNPNKKRSKQARIFDEWDDLAKEERLNKKLKQGKISKAEYKTLMYGDSKSENDKISDELMDSDIE